MVSEYGVAKQAAGVVDFCGIVIRQCCTVCVLAAARAVRVDPLEALSTSVRGRRIARLDADGPHA
jgi:hypothetical protein